MRKIMFLQILGSFKSSKENWIHKSHLCKSQNNIGSTNRKSANNQINLINPQICDLRNLTADRPPSLEYKNLEAGVWGGGGLTEPCSGH
jgi:hypothetical protein